MPWRPRFWPGTPLRAAGTPATKAHAVSAAGTNTYGYDCNGNLTTRNIGTSYTLSYDAESRLTGVSGAASASYVYDGDGQRVKGTVAGVTTHGLPRRPAGD